MSKKDDVREFLISRRSHITPEQAGLTGVIGERRVPGLRREEVAALAGVSLDYYTRLERGNIRGASESVLNAIAHALQLNDVEREHLFDLARTPSGPARTASPLEPAPTELRHSVRRVLDSMTLPAVAWNSQHDLLAANAVGQAFCAPMFEAQRPNIARFTFLDPRARDYYVDWDQATSMTAAMLRREAGRDPLNEGLTALIGELSTRSPHFRREWAKRDVHEHRTGRKLYRHPEVGIVEVTFDVFELPGEAGLFITTYSADEGSESADKLALLTLGAATRQTERFSIPSKLGRDVTTPTATAAGQE